MPAYSIGKSSKKASFITTSNVPGVGAYSSDQKRSSKVLRGPTFIIGRSARLKTDKPIGPGPNIYDTTKNSFFADKNKGYHITGKVRERIRSEGPGPASYSIPKMFTTKNYSFGVRTQIVKLSTDGPGPGDYDVEKVRYQHAISFEQSKRPSPQGSPTLRPGPGEYNNDGLRETKNKFAFPKRTKFFQQSQQSKQKTRIPGPGTYSNLNINSIKKQIIAARFTKTKRDILYGDPNIPGPGAYSPTNSQKRSPVATIGNSPKGTPTDKNPVPGPATYKNLEIGAIKRKEPSTVFGKSYRDEHVPQMAVKAGPGSYNIDYHDRGHAYSMSGRNSQEKIDPFPGPLSYSPKYDSQFRKTEMAIMGRDRKFQQQKGLGPGPGAYKIEQGINKSKTFYFPKQIRKWNLNSNPGPGTYDLKPIIGSEVSPTNKK